MVHLTSDSVNKILASPDKELPYGVETALYPNEEGVYERLITFKGVEMDDDLILIGNSENPQLSFYDSKFNSLNIPQNKSCRGLHFQKCNFSGHARIDSGSYDKSVIFEECTFEDDFSTGDPTFKEALTVYRQPKVDRCG